MGRSAYSCIVSVGVLLLALPTVAAYRPVFDATGTTLFDSSIQLRQLQQAQQSLNCTPARTVNDTKKPFCFQPETISSEARQFLSKAASGATALGSSSPGTSEQQIAALQAARNYYRDISVPLHEAAVAQYLQSVSNSTIGNVPVVVGVPKGVQETDKANTKVLLYMHGGGYAIGSCQFLLNTVAATAAGAGLTIICPEYRLAPENPFPAGINDLLTVYKTMIKNEGYNPKNIVFVGDSAGGGFVAATAVQLQREGEPLPAALGMFSPWADLSSKGDTSVTLNAVDPVIPGVDPAGPAYLGSLGGVYISGNTSLLSDPLVSPVLANYADLFPNQSLPPTLIQVGLRETLLSDAVRLYHRMREAAPAPGHVKISPYEGMWHVFQAYVNVPEAAVASREMADYLSRALKGQICK